MRLGESLLSPLKDKSFSSILAWWLALVANDNSFFLVESDPAPVHSLLSGKLHVLFLYDQVLYAIASSTSTELRGQAVEFIRFFARITFFICSFVTNARRSIEVWIRGRLSHCLRAKTRSCGTNCTRASERYKVIIAQHTMRAILMSLAPFL
jgi:hypothetical protein